VRRGRKGVMEVRCAEEEDWTVKDMGRWIISVYGTG
jgi:hypothetical protein